ncbi:MAG: hypothetical protein PWR01_3080 [Clostridiales bacterium]|jgi:type II secretory pathway pseudopilin PulG|nr:hypothetical protein [Clostridiales bacterium]MDN5282007.1 hypothetical protein [Candidatus Ozemobacter sp.]
MSIKCRKGTNLLELLLALSILSAAMYPIVYIFKMARPAARKTQTEFLATMLSHHVMETIVANKIADPNYLPPMSEALPVVATENAVQQVSDYFKFISDQGGPVRESDNGQLYWPLKQFKCQVDTYYLEGLLYKAIVYISYHNEGRDMKVFLERLLAQPQITESEDSFSETEGKAE